MTDVQNPEGQAPESPAPPAPAEVESNGAATVDDIFGEYEEFEVDAEKRTRVPLDTYKKVLQSIPKGRARAYTFDTGPIIAQWTAEEIEAYKSSHDGKTPRPRAASSIGRGENELAEQRNFKAAADVLGISVGVTYRHLPVVEGEVRRTRLELVPGPKRPVTAEQKALREASRARNEAADAVKANPNDPQLKTKYAAAEKAYNAAKKASDAAKANGQK